MDIFNRIPRDVQKLVVLYFSHPNADSIRAIPKDICIPTYNQKYNLGKALADKPIHTKLGDLGRKTLYNKKIRFKILVTNLTNVYKKVKRGDRKHIQYHERKIVKLFRDAPNPYTISSGRGWVGVRVCQCTHLIIHVDVTIRKKKTKKRPMKQKRKKKKYNKNNRSKRPRGNKRSNHR